MEEIPFGDQFEKAVWSFNKTAGKRIVADVGSKIYKMLTTSTDPFFRRDMGERYFTGVAFGNGVLLWFLSAIASCAFGSLFIGPKYAVVALLLGLGVLAGFFYFATENLKHIAVFRADGKTYHSKSRGADRWPDPAQGLGIRVGACLLLLLLAPVTGVAFIASMYTSASLQAQQQAALYDRYLDMLDAQIEGTILQDAMLGKCPPELTYLYKPLPSSLKSELREDIAAAAVGKPVRILAQAPKPTTAALHGRED